MTRVCIVSASGQNVFFDELLGALESALRGHGVETERAVDHFPPVQEGLAYLFVPHEYMALTMPEAHPRPAALKRTVAICTEQPGTHWFDAAAEIAKQAAGAVDINSEGVAALRHEGIAARRLQLGWVPEWDRWGGDETRARPIDATFLGSYTDRRAGVLAACGEVLAPRRAWLHLSDSSVPYDATSEWFLAGERKWDHLASCSTLINVHRSPLAYLEWQRVVETIANGCVVVTEHSLGASPLVAGEHFVSASYDTLPVVLRALLEDPDRIAAIRREAYRMLREELPLSATVGPLVDAVAEAARASVVGTRRGPLNTQPYPRRLPARLPEYERLASERTESDVTRMALKHLLLAQQDLRRRLDHDAVGDAPDTVERHGEQPATAPKASVVLTVYNYGHTVGEAIRSVAGSDYADRELVIVDDASTDDSLAICRAALADSPELPATIVHRGRNQGLAHARNLGVEHARGDYVFILDADNVVYPHCLGRLADALDSDPDAAFAYGILEVFDRGGPRDLMSWQPWDAQRLRYGNFVDAMAMVRREPLRAVGGYTLDPRLYGWEDFALWCTFAERGWRGVLVPEIVARYRRGLLSMISLTDIDSRAAWGALIDSYPVLSGAAPSGS